MNTPEERDLDRQEGENVNRLFKVFGLLVMGWVSNMAVDYHMTANQMLPTKWKFFAFLGNLIMLAALLGLARFAYTFWRICRKRKKLRAIPVDTPQTRGSTTPASDRIEQTGPHTVHAR